MDKVSVLPIYITKELENARKAMNNTLTILKNTVDGQVGSYAAGQVPTNLINIQNAVNSLTSSTNPLNTALKNLNTKAADALRACTPPKK